MSFQKNIDDALAVKDVTGRDRELDHKHYSIIKKKYYTKEEIKMVKEVKNFSCDCGCMEHGGDPIPVWSWYTDAIASID